MYIIQLRDNAAGIVTILETARTVREAQAMQRNIRRAIGRAMPALAVVQIDRA